MKNTFKLFALVLAALLAVTCLSACSLKDILGSLSPALPGSETSEPENTADDSGGSSEGTRVTFLDLTITVPEGFQKSSMSTDGCTVYVPGDWPLHSDNISITFTSEAGSADNYTSENIKQMLEETLKTEVTNYKFSKDKVEGADRVSASYNVVVNGISMDQEMLIYIIGKKSMVSVTFTNVSGEFVNDFAASKASITID
ncbi:MAG: hypothetical protein J5912_00095 [Clostridia bacterium]|nr:hypothetical protein [Clostridia bacterium]